MAGCIEKTFCLLWSIIIGLLRLFLFLVALTILISQIVLISSLTYIHFLEPEYKDYLPTIAYREFSAPVGLVVLLLLGCHSAASNNKRRLRWFSLLTAIVGALMTFGFGFYKYYDRQGEMTQVADRLKNLEAQYEWNRSWTVQSMPNRVIDFVQRTGECCGIDAPSEWDRLRPSTDPPNSYPSSCCPYKKIERQFPTDMTATQYCSLRSIYIEGCRRSIQNVGSISNAANMSIGVLLVLLAIISLIVGCMQCDEKSQSSTQLVTIRPTNNSEPERFHYNETRIQPIYQDPQANLRAPLMYPEPPSYVEESRDRYGRRV